MAEARKKQELRLVRDERESKEKWQLEGYQRLDDNIVMYRRYLPVTKELNAILLQIYDFNAYQQIIVLDSKGYNAGGGASGSMQVTNFRDLGNKRAIKDAHQALTDLGGTPPALNDVLGIPDND